ERLAGHEAQDFGELGEVVARYRLGTGLTQLEHGALPIADASSSSPRRGLARLRPPTGPAPAARQRLDQLAAARRRHIPSGDRRATSALEEGDVEIDRDEPADDFQKDPDAPGGRERLIEDGFQAGEGTVSDHHPLAGSEGRLP